MTLTIIITHKFGLGQINLKAINRTINSIKTHINIENNTKWILALDNLTPEENSFLARLYFRRLVAKLEFIHDNLKLSVPSNHSHLSGNLSTAFSLVDSTHVLVAHSDTPFIRFIDVLKLMSLEEVDYIRFNRRANVVAGWDTELVEVNFDKVTLCKSLFYSDVNHLAKVDFYQNQILPAIHEKHGFPEIILRGRNWEQFGMFLYGGLGSSATCSHYALWDRLIVKEKSKSNLLLALVIASFKWAVIKITVKNNYFTKKLFFGSGIK